MILIRILLIICFAWLAFSFGLSIMLTAAFELPDRREIVKEAREHTLCFMLLWSGEIV